ncbi:MAG: DivIVA domain-containing protein [Oscillospiraceae bacterium]|nr:DivIVA domain-containing protein [Oscillospiraceae bacterium]
MLTPQEVAEHAFSKAAFGGYNMAMVDEFLDELTDDYTALYKENAALKAKMKVLVEKVEEYRATEDAMRRALLTAQNMANTMVSEAEEKKETLIADAEMEARARIGALHDEIVSEQKRLNLIKAQTREFVENTRVICERQIRQLDLLPNLTPEQVEKTTAEAKEQSSAAADVDALSRKIVSSYQDESPTAAFSTERSAEAAKGDAEEATLRFPTAKGKSAAAKGGDTRIARFGELKFGRNFNGEA